MDTRGSGAVLFRADNARAVELVAADAVALQAFFDCNPEYFLAVNGQGPGAAEAHEEIHGTLPEGWPFTKQWTIGFFDEYDSLAGMANVVSDLLAPGVWHIGLMIIATRLHGSGLAQSLYLALERWARDSGAKWIRLGVVEDNARAVRFWGRCGFSEVRKRPGMQMGTRVNTVRVMAKPLAGGTLAEYLERVARDRPES